MMYRKVLPRNRGMLFLFQSEHHASFWMKNTLIPLDLIFIRADGTIARIATAEPLALTSIVSGAPVASVLEIAGGRAAKLGIVPGDRVEFAL